MTFALALIPLVAGAGVAIDYAHDARAKTKLQATFDEAALAGTRALVNQEADPSGAATKFIDAVYGNAARKPAATVDVQQGSGTVTVSGTLVVENSIMGVFGQPTTTVSALAQASGAAGQSTGKLEVAMVVDITGSMGQQDSSGSPGTKMHGVVTASNNLMTTLFNVPNAKSRVKVGIVPFNNYAGVDGNLGWYEPDVDWLSGPVIQTEQCVTSADPALDTCTGAMLCDPQPIYSTTQFTTCYATNDGAQYSYSCPVLLNNPVCTGHAPAQTGWFAAVGTRGAADNELDLTEDADIVTAANPVPRVYGVNADPLMRLTNDTQKLGVMINGGNDTAGNTYMGFEWWVNGDTFIAPGLLWGWRVLSPNAPYADGAPYNDGTTTKSIVLLTDGNNTYGPSYPRHDDGSAAGIANANRITAATCELIKKKGIHIYTIGFDVTDPTVKSLLQNCANTYVDYYDAPKVADMQAALAAIGTKLTSSQPTPVRLVR